MSSAGTPFSDSLLAAAAPDEAERGEGKNRCGGGFRDGFEGDAGDADATAAAADSVLVVDADEGLRGGEGERGDGVGGGIGHPDELAQGKRGPKRRA
jgi:hypothetical protein